MTYWLGKDVDIFMTTESPEMSVSGNITTTGMTAISGAIWNNVGTGDYFGIPMRASGMIANARVTDVTGIDFTPTTMDESISYMGYNTNLTAEIKKAMVLTITRKVSNPLFDYVYQYARDGVYSTDGPNVSTSPTIFDGLTSSNNVNFGYRIILRFASGTTVPTDEVLAIRNCCVTSHSKSMTPDGATEETVELYSYVQPVMGVSDSTALTAATTGTEI